MRIVNRALAFVLAVALLAASVILIIEVIAHTLNHAPVIVHWTTWQHWADRTAWNRAVIKDWSIVLIVTGALILLLELKPRRKRRLTFASHADATDAAITTKGLAGTVHAAAVEVDGIRRATVGATTRKVKVKATSAAHDKAAAYAVREPLTQAAQARIDGLALQHPPRLSVRVTARSR
jgi:hypothetical protein